MKDITPLFDHIQKIIDILNIIKNKIDDDTNVIWTEYDTPQALINKLDLEINNLQSRNYKTISNINGLFIPTGTLQEVSISNGWGDEFLTLAEQFDHHYEKVAGR